MNSRGPQLQYQTYHGLKYHDPGVYPDSNTLILEVKITVSKKMHSIAATLLTHCVLQGTASDPACGKYPPLFPLVCGLSR